MPVSNDLLETLRRIAADWDFPEATDRIEHLQSEIARLEQRVGWLPVDHPDTPAACHVLATRFNHHVGEWVCGVVMSPPISPFTHWMPLPEPPARALTKDSSDG